MKAYRPSNGDEGMWFTDKYCMNCINCDPDSNGKKQCEIMMRSMMYDTNNKEYPIEWVYDEKGQPQCTAYKKWDWEIQGNPDDPENPNYQQPFNPNQLDLFS